MFEAVARAAFGVSVYGDVFERIALHPRLLFPFVPALRWRLSAEVMQGEVLFIHIPRAGGTSARSALYRCNPGHMSARYYSLAAPELLERDTTFAVFREPVERFLSAARFAINRGGAHVRVEPSALKGLRRVSSLDAFLDYVEAARGDWLKVDNPARPQTWYIADRDGRIRVRNLFVLGAQTDQIERHIGRFTSKPLTHLNRTKRASVRLTEAQLKRVHALYADDFAIYRALLSGGRPDVLHGLTVSDLRGGEASSPLSVSRRHASALA
jgi:hypothetical protein